RNPTEPTPTWQLPVRYRSSRLVLSSSKKRCFLVQVSVNCLSHYPGNRDFLFLGDMFQFRVVPCRQRDGSANRVLLAVVFGLLVWHRSSSFESASPYTTVVHFARQD